MTQTPTNTRDWGALKRLALECEKYGGLRTPEYEAAANPATVLELIAEVERSRTERYELKLLIAGGEDAPGHADSMTITEAQRVVYSERAQTADLHAEILALKSQRDEMAEALEKIAAQDNKNPELTKHDLIQWAKSALRRVRSSINKTEKTDG